MERLQKYIARCGAASRRKAEEMISEGRVTVNESVVTQPGQQIDPEKDRVSVDQKRLRPSKHLTILLYKPDGVVSTCDDPQRRKTVLDLIPAQERLFPVGRLDYHTEGLLLLTNDGALANRLTHPRYRVAKTYLVETDSLLSTAQVAALTQGIKLDDGPTQPARVKTEYSDKEGSRFYLTITEGRNRQVRRMCEALGLTVTKLCRTNMGFLNLHGLIPGQYRKLSAEETARLRRSVDLV